MRNVFAKTITEISKKIKKIILLSGDIGISFLTTLKLYFQIDLLTVV